MQTAAQAALVIPEILENILLRVTIRHEPDSIRNIRLAGRLWRDTMDGILLNRVSRNQHGSFRDDISWQPLTAIIETRGGCQSIRTITCYQPPEQFSLCTGLTRLDIFLDGLILRESRATPIVLPNLRRLTIGLYSSRKALSALEREDLLQTKGSASLHLRFLVNDKEKSNHSEAALRSIIGSCKQSLETLKLTHYRNDCGTQTFDILRELLPALSHLQRVVLDVDLVPSMMRLTNSTLPPLLPYVEVGCTHESARAVLHNIAKRADPSASASLYRFVLRCRGFRSSQDSRLHENRAEAAREAIAAWKEKRGVEVPELVAQSWLESECIYW